MPEEAAAKVTTGDSPELKSAQIITVLAAIAGVGSILAVLQGPISYFVESANQGTRDQKFTIYVMIVAILFLIPSLFIGAHAVAAFQKRDLYPERDGLLIASIAAATVVLIRLGSLARTAVEGGLDFSQPKVRFWFDWGLVPVDPQMNGLVRVIGIAVLFSIGAAVIASGLFIVETKLVQSAYRNTLTRGQRTGVIIVVVVVYLQGSQRWTSGNLALADVAGALVVAVFAFVGGIPGERAAVIVGMTIASFTVASILSVAVQPLIFGQADTDGLLEFVLLNGLLVVGCARRCSNGARWKESIHAPRRFLEKRVSVGS